MLAAPSVPSSSMTHRLFLTRSPQGRCSLGVCVPLRAGQGRQGPQNSSADTSPVDELETRFTGLQRLHQKLNKFPIAHCLIVRHVGVFLVPSLVAIRYTRQINL